MPGSAISRWMPSCWLTGNAAEIEVNRVVQHARQCVPAQHNALFVFESALTGQLLNLQEEEQRFGLAHGEAAQNINHGLGSIVREVLNCASGEIKGLYMTGGDTMVNVLKELGGTGIEMIDYVIPQTDMVRNHWRRLCRLNLRRERRANRTGRYY